MSATKLNTSKIHVLLYSPSQQCYHVETLDLTIRNSLIICRKFSYEHWICMEERPDFMPVFVSHDENEVRNADPLGIYEPNSKRIGGGI